MSATIASVLVVCHSILNGASAIQNLADDWFSVTQDFKSKVDLLRQKVDYYEKEMSKHGMSVDSGISNSLHEAEEQLKTSERKVRMLDDTVKRSQCFYAGWWLYAKLKMILLPQRLEKILKKVTDEIDKVTVSLKLEAEMGAHFTKWSERKAIPTTIHDNDELYVPIKQSVQQVIKAIEDTRGPPIILLYGGVGKGKSTLARYVCQLYGEFGDKRKDNFFDIVHSVSCGNRPIPDPSIKQMEILQHISPTSFDESSKKETSISKSRVARALYDYLSSKQKILIILDDVSDQRFLYEMWKASTGSKHVKYVVTSQRSDLCSSLTSYSLPIWMGDPDEDEAKAILASLIGLEQKVIPSHLQKIADKMIEETERNPLALACLASNFTHTGDKYNKREWQDAYRSLYNLLDNPQIKIVLGENHETPPVSAWDALRLCLHSLETVEARVVLFLMYAFEGEWVPEEVVRVLYDATIMSRVTFLKASEDLFTRDLLKRRTGTVAPYVSSKGEDDKGDDSVEYREWSLRFLVKGYMNRHVAGRKEIKSILEGLFGDKEISEEEVKSLFCDLFGDHETAPESSVTKKPRSAKEDQIVDTKKATVAMEKTTQRYSSAKPRRDSEREIAVESEKKQGYAKKDRTVDTEKETVAMEETIQDSSAKSRRDSERENSVDSDRKQVALCGLYFDKAHIDKAVADYATLATDRFKIMHSKVDAKNKRRKKAIEPITFLLDQPKEDSAGWTEFKIFSTSTRQVFLNYVRKCEVDELNTCNLLKLASYPSAQLAAVKALASIFSMQETPLPKEEDFWNALVDLLGSKDLNLREAASTALFHLCNRATKECSTSLATKRTLDALVSLIQNSLVSRPQGLGAETLTKNATKNAIKTLRMLSYTLDVALSGRTQSS